MRLASKLLDKHRCRKRGEYGLTAQATLWACAARLSRRQVARRSLAAFGDNLVLDALAFP